MSVPRNHPSVAENRLRLPGAGAEVGKGSISQQVKACAFVLNAKGALCRIFIHESKIKGPGVFLRKSLLGQCN